MEFRAVTRMIRLKAVNAFMDEQLALNAIVSLDCYFKKALQKCLFA